MNILKEYMAKNDLTISRVAEELKVSVGTVNRWMRNKTRPYGRNAYKIEKLTQGNIPASYWEQRDMNI